MQPRPLVPKPQNRTLGRAMRSARLCSLVLLHVDLGAGVKSSLPRQGALRAEAGLRYVSVCGALGAGSRPRRPQGASEGTLRAPWAVTRPRGTLCGALSRGLGTGVLPFPRKYRLSSTAVILSRGGVREGGILGGLGHPGSRPSPTILHSNTTRQCATDHTDECANRDRQTPHRRGV